MLLLIGQNKQYFVVWKIYLEVKILSPGQLLSFFANWYNNCFVKCLLLHLCLNRFQLLIGIVKVFVIVIIKVSFMRVWHNLVSLLCKLMCPESYVSYSTASLKVFCLFVVLDVDVCCFVFKSQKTNCFSHQVLSRLGLCLNSLLCGLMWVTELCPWIF